MSEREQEQRDQIWDRATAMLLWAIETKMPWDLAVNTEEVQEAIELDYPIATIKDAWM